MDKVSSKKTNCIKHLEALTKRLKKADLSEAQLDFISTQLNTLAAIQGEYQEYRLKSKRELNKIPGSKEFWYRFDEKSNPTFLLRPARVFSNDLMECSSVHRSDCDKFLVDKHGNAVHKEAVELVA